MDTSAPVIGDKGYAGSQVYAQPKDNELHPRVWTPALGWLRKSIESVFSSLLRSRHLLMGQLNSFWFSSNIRDISGGKHDLKLLLWSHSLRIKVITTQQIDVLKPCRPCPR